MSDGLKKRSIIMKKTLNMERNNYYNYSKDKNLTKYMNESKENINCENIPFFKNNTQQITKGKETTNNSLIYGKEFTFNKDENTNILNISSKNKKILKNKLILSFLPSNNFHENLLTDINNSKNKELSSIETYNNTIQNLNNLNNNIQDKIMKNESQDNFINIRQSRNKFSNLNNSLLNNSVFIKKKPKVFLRNNSSKHRNFKNTFDESINSIINKTHDNFENQIKTKDNIVNKTINININNNYLVEESNINIIEKYNIKRKKHLTNNVTQSDINKKHIKKLTDIEKFFFGRTTSNKFYIRKNKYMKNNNEDNLINMKLPNIEDLLLIIQKFEIIKGKFASFNNIINKYNSKKLLEYINNIRIRIYDLYKFYLSCSLEGSPHNFFSTKISKNYLQYYSTILILSIVLSYTITKKIKTSIDYKGKLLILLELQEKAFMIFCDNIIKKLHNNYQNNIYVIEIIKKLNNQLISNADTVNHILQIKMLTGDSYKIINDILINIYIHNEKDKSYEQEIFLYKHFYNKDINYITHFNINELEEIFNRNIFKPTNLRSNYTNITSPNNLNNKYKQFNKNNNNISNNNINLKKTIKTPYLNFPPSKPYTLVLDLDETMICFKFTEINQGLGKLHLRPGLEEFLEEIKKYYEIIVFTSATKEYAESIINVIEQKNNTKYFSSILYREHTTLIGNKYIKDLSKLGRDLSKTIIVDNLPHSFKFQRENGILISSFYGDNLNDKALYELERILINIYKEKADVRESLIKFREDIIKHITCINECSCKYKNK